MNIQSATFVTSLPRYGDFPGIGLPQIAVAGKSNVGKSSLINGLCRQKNLAKTSSTPGKTRLINVFLLNNAFHLIDLPGYGYAKVSKKEKATWGQMMGEYFSFSQTLKSVIQLVDIRHLPSKEDEEMVQFLRANDIPFILVATKADKLSRAQRQRSVNDIAHKLIIQPWEITSWSAQTGEGKDAILQQIGKALE
ncbi:MAG TPA: YihA family ribosome biogenesis GTP-binding protein [Clostridiales bacterium]|jgi:GTP-binding protein|nr:YihA family ribosome biogenesis GTP-binding protein [Clostridiales bacterium]